MHSQIHTRTAQGRVDLLDRGYDQLLTHIDQAGVGNVVRGDYCIYRRTKSLGNGE
jgi:hypothetical protein